VSDKVGEERDLADALLPSFPMIAFAGLRVLEALHPTWIALALGTVAVWVASVVG